MRTSASRREVSARALVRIALPLVVLGIATIAAFAPALQAEFVAYDDNLNFVSNERFRGLSPEHLEWMFTTGWMGHYQPLSWVTLAADYVGAGGLDGPAFHRTNLLLHLVVAGLFLLLAVRLYSRAGVRAGAAGPGASAHWVAALVAALLFAIHPLRVESVAWITERRDVLSGVFFVAALLVWVRGPGDVAVRRFGLRAAVGAAVLAAISLGLALSALNLEVVEALSLRPGGRLRLGLAFAALVALAVLVSPRRRDVPGFSGFLLLLLLSLFAKAWGLVMPALLLVLDFWPRSRGRAIDLVLEKLPFVVLSGVFGVLAGWAQAGLYGTMKSLGQHGWSERFLQACYGLVFYPAKTLVPVSLGPFYDLPQRLDPLEPRFLVPVLVVIVGFVLLVLLARRGHGMWLAVFAAYGIIVSPVLGLAQSGPQLVAERYSYLAMLPFALLGGSAALTVMRRGGRKNLGLAALAGGLVLLALGTTTHRQTRTWRSSEALWAHVREVRPEHAAGWLWEASQRMDHAAEVPDPEERARLLYEAIGLLEEGALRSSEPQLISKQGLARTQLSGAEPDRAEEHREQAAVLQGRALRVAIEQQQYRPYYSLRYGVSLVEAGRPEDALRHLQEYARRRPSSAEGHEELGRAYLGLDRTGDALVELERAVELQPERPSAWRRLGVARQRAGSPAEASRAFQRALSLDPNDPETRRLFVESLGG